MSWYQEQRGHLHTAIDKSDKAAVKKAISVAAKAIKRAKYVLITTGAGMGVDSGVPDFRTGQSFWDGLNHPDIKKYEDMSDDSWFQKDPELAWGLNMHQIKTYREATPHAGFDVLKRICEAKGEGKWFCWTSNVDGMLQQAGFDAARIYEVHGQIHRLQCTRGRHCGRKEGLSLSEELLWGKAQRKDPWVSEGNVSLEYDGDYRACDADSLPTCQQCGAMARPNIWFCADKNYTPYGPSCATSSRYQEWRQEVAADEGCEVVVIECGGGVVIPSVRCEGEILMEEAQESGNFSCTLVRINPSDFAVPDGAVGVPFGAANGLRRIEEIMQKLEA